MTIGFADTTGGTTGDTTGGSAGATTGGGTTGGATSTTGGLQVGVGDPCGDPSPSCPAGLDCINAKCLIPPHSPTFQCQAPADCEPDAHGEAIDCQEKICCNEMGAPCAVENDCCTAQLCVQGVCILETDHGYCSAPGDCASNHCSSSQYCTCVPDGLPSNSYLQCCSGQLGSVLDAGPACKASTVRLACPPNACSPNTEQCQGTCCITSMGSKTEPCARAQDCCQLPVAMACTSETCCNTLNGPCRTNDDCCVSNICNALQGEVGLCKINSGTSICNKDADCISNSCATGTGICD